MTLAAGSLFTGGGGMDYGLEAAGWATRWQVEIAPWNQHVLEFGWGGRWRDVPRYGDIRAVDFAQLEPVTLLHGGFPCQPISAAGRRLGRADERCLWPEFARAVRDLRPRFVLVENVAGLLRPYPDPDTGEILPALIADVVGDLAALGFDSEWTSFPAAALGAPHLRDRVWIVGWDVSHPPRERDGRPRLGAGGTDPARRVSSSAERTTRGGPGGAGSAPRRPLADAGRGRRDEGRDALRDRNAEPHGRGALADAGSPGPEVAGDAGDIGGPRGGGQAALAPRRGLPADVADAEGEPVGAGLREDRPGGVGRRRSRDGGRTRDVADAASFGVEGDGADWLVIPPAPRLAGLLGRYGAGAGWDLWAVEPDVGRMAHGVARRGDRLWTLGNGVVPACAEVMGTLIREALER